MLSDVILENESQFPRISNYLRLKAYCGDGSHGTGYVFRGYPLGAKFFFRLKRISEALLDNSFGLYLLIPLTLSSGFLHTRYYNYLQ